MGKDEFGYVFVAVYVSSSIDNGMDGGIFDGDLCIGFGYESLHVQASIISDVLFEVYSGDI